MATSYGHRGPGDVPMRPWWRRMLAPWIALLVALGLLLAPALAGERLSLFDAKGRRTGYAVVDQKTGRVDFFDKNSRRTGWDRVDSTGKVERFGLDGKRQEGTALPITREPKGR